MGLQGSYQSLGYRKNIMGDGSTRRDSMRDARDALRLYKLLADKALSRVTEVPAAHKTLFRPTQASVIYYQTLYLDQVDSGHPPRKRPGNATCQYCVSFHLGNLKTIDKMSDIIFSKHLEQCFQEFIEDQLNISGAVVTCQRADQQDLHMPDFKIVRRR